MESLLKKWKQMLTGEGMVSLQDDRVIKRVRAIEQEAAAWWTAMNKDNGRTYLWTDAATDHNSSDLTTMYTRLLKMALAYATTGSQLYKDQRLLQDLLDALDWTYEHRYNERVQPYSNWWHWEIGSPLALTNIMVLLFEELPDDRIKAYVSAIDRCSPDPCTFLSTRNDVSASTGANRVWICTVIAVRSMLVNDGGMLRRVRDALLPVFQYTQEGDGFYEDGSFIQHDFHPYTGGYGKSLLVELAKLLVLLQSSPYAIQDSSLSHIYRWVYEAFAPLMYRGSLMDMVRGREIARSYTQNHEAGHEVITGTLLLSLIAPEDEASMLKSLAAQWMRQDTAKTYTDHVSLFLIGIAENALKDTDRSLSSHAKLKAFYDAKRFQFFAGMDRATAMFEHFAAGISLYSARVASYESINGENLKGWYTSHGFTAIYDADVLQYCDGYWPTVDQSRLAGTTVSTLARAPGEGNNTRSTKHWVGGSALGGRYGAVGMELEDYPQLNGEYLSARKSWFIHQEAIIAMGSDIHLNAPEHVETIVENRKIDSKHAKLVVNGSKIIEGTCNMPVDWAHLETGRADSRIGYVFPQRSCLELGMENRSGSWADIGAGSTEKLERAYCTLSIDHGISPTDGSYGYILLPGKSVEETASFYEQAPIQIIECSEYAHAVQVEGSGWLAANFWQAEGHTVGPLTCRGKASVQLVRSLDGIELAVSDPTQLQDEIVIELAGKFEGTFRPHSRVQMHETCSGYQFIFDVSNTNGATVVAHY